LQGPLRLDYYLVVDIRTEAVMQALALNKKQSMIPMPSKRTSAAYSQNKPAHTDRITGKKWLLVFCWF